MQLIDLSHTLSADTPQWSASWPQPELSVVLSHAEAAASGHYQDCSCEIHRISFVTSVSTYLDSPYHFNFDGATIDLLPLEACVLPGVCVDARGLAAGQEISGDVLRGFDVSGRAVLICTGWSAHWGTPRYDTYPFLSQAAIDGLRDGGAKMVGVDTLTIDNSANPRRPAHVGLLFADILIAENLTGLERLIGREFAFHAAPVKVQGAAAFPVRAYAVLD